MIALHVVPATAATQVWDGGSISSNDWTDSANWNPDGTPTAGDTLVFGAGTKKATHNDYFKGLSLAALVFNATGFSVAGNTIDLTQKGTTSTRTVPGR